MGHVFALCGPSGVGKTTFLAKLHAESEPRLRWLTRATLREPRLGERQGVDYEFYRWPGFLQKLFASDFAHCEEYGDSFFAIDSLSIADVIQGEDDGIIMSGIYGALGLRRLFAGNVTILYMHVGTRRSLLDPGILDLESDENVELRRRLMKKISEGVLQLGSEPVDAFSRRRMERSLVELAHINGRIRSGEPIVVLENLRDQMDDTVSQFRRMRLGTTGRGVQPYSTKVSQSVFVLMPFREDFRTIFDDHIVPTAHRAGLQCRRADGIFSNRPIMDDILDAVREARIVISDLSERNPNVFYETGICHALGKEVILITREREVPFDLTHLRRIQYEFTPRGMHSFEAVLEKTLRAILET